jgi:hypothetical protein
VQAKIANVIKKLVANFIFEIKVNLKHGSSNISGGFKKLY